MKIDYANFDIFSNAENFNDFDNYFETVNAKINFCLTHCDFEMLSNILENCKKNLLSNDNNEQIYLKTNREFAKIFDDMSTFFNDYNLFLLNQKFNDQNIESLKINLRNLM